MAKNSSHTHYVSKALRDARKAKGLTQSEAANLLGVHQHTISQYETGSRTPDVDTFYSLANTYDTSPANFWPDPKTIAMQANEIMRGNSGKKNKED